MDVRGRRLRKQSDDAAVFTSSTAYDGRIAAHVVRINMAHTVSLVRSGAVDPSRGGRCLGFLLAYPDRPASGGSAEDFHQQLEQEAVDRLGVGVAGYMNLGKSRNDQVSTAIRMELRSRVLDLVGSVSELQEALLRTARDDGGILVPGYTHLQRAQPATLAHYAFAYFDAAQRDVERLFELYRRVNLCPMGAAALGGTNVPVDRRLVAEALGFDGVIGNAMDAVSSRDFAVEAISCAAMVMLDISRLAEEQVLWSTKEFGFVELADEYSASSSIMPQKKNPVVAEVARSKAGSVIGTLVSACTIMKALPFAYNLDLQEVTPHLWAAYDDAVASVRMLARSFSALKFNEAALAGSMSEDYSTSTALANYLAKEHSISFREAHAIVGELVRRSLLTGAPLMETAVADLPKASRRFGRTMSIDAQTARTVLDPEGYLGEIATEGGANPAFIPKEAEKRLRALKLNRERLSAERSSIDSSAKALVRTSRNVAKGVTTKK